ncbi:MAG: ATP-binding protein [Pseudonocardiaceae bacterium]
MTVAEHELANRDLVVAELGVLRAHVRGEDPADAQRVLEVARADFTEPSTLDELAKGFGLTAFERSVLLLAAGPELVDAVADELAARGGGTRLTFGTALAMLPGAHWSALTPPAPLRRWDLVQLLEPSSPTRSPLAVDERVLHHLAGVGYLDAGLAAISRPVVPPPWLPGPLRYAANAVAAAWRLNRPAVVHGPQPGNVRSVVAAAAAGVGLTLLEVTASALPTVPQEREHALRCMERETVLAGCAWALDVTGSRVEDVGPLLRGLAAVDAPVAVLAGSQDGVPPPNAVPVAIERLSVGDRREALVTALRCHGAHPEPDAVAVAAGVFDLAMGDLDAVALDVAEGGSLWTACRTRARIGLGALATVLAPRAGWADLVLPPQQLDQLRALVAAVRHRALVLHDWGFAGRSTRGLGMTALFTGPSGTGKTLAAEVIAHELGLDLVRIDLSQVVSKYIGETEKHLRRVFDAAEDGAAVLLFDEADTLFGKRSEVRDSHDRYANLEVGYLLQRMESFRGLAILTTNARSALDQAFTRRLRTIVTFPYPDLAAREALWRNAFPEQTPVHSLDPTTLAAVDLPGGGITAIALGAAYLAAAQDSPVEPQHVRTATRWELAKTGRTAAGAQLVRRRP